MSTVTPPAGCDATDTTGKAGELKVWIGQLIEHLRSRGPGEKDTSGQPLPPTLAQLTANRDAAVARLRSAVAQRSASATGEDGSGAGIVLAWLLGTIERYAAIYAEIEAGAAILDKLENENYAATKAPIHEVNPSRDYWFERSDGPGEHQWSEDGNYLALTIPRAGTAAYFNAEIYNNPRTHIQPRNILIEPFPLDKTATKEDQHNWDWDWLRNLPYIPANRVVFQARVRAENLKGGSRGWGFWNMSLSPETMQIAWFVQYDGVKTGDLDPAVPSGFYVETQNGLSGLDKMMYRLPDLDEDWHDYRIELNSGSVFYFIDGKLVHQVWGATVPVNAMQFHCWVDNSVFGVGPLIVNHICQSTDFPRSNIIHSMSIVSPPNASPVSP
jgi:hypothetical protein